MQTTKTAQKANAFWSTLNALAREVASNRNARVLHFSFAIPFTPPRSSHATATDRTAPPEFIGFIALLFAVNHKDNFHFSSSLVSHLITQRKTHEKYEKNCRLRDNIRRSGEPFTISIYLNSSVNDGTSDFERDLFKCRLGGSKIASQYFFLK